MQIEVTTPTSRVTRSPDAASWEPLTKTLLPPGPGSKSRRLGSLGTWSCHRWYMFLRITFLSAWTSAPHPPGGSGPGFWGYITVFESHQIIYTDFRVNTHPRTMPSSPRYLGSAKLCPHKAVHVLLRFAGDTRESVTFPSRVGGVYPLSTFPYSPRYSQQIGLAQNSKKQRLFHNFCPSQRHMTWRHISEITDKQVVLLFNSSFSRLLSTDSVGTKKNPRAAEHQQCIKAALWTKSGFTGLPERTHFQWMS